MSKVKTEKHEIIAQIVGHKSLKIAGGLRVEIDIPDASGKDIAIMSAYAVHKSHVKLIVKPYTPKEIKAEGFARG